MPVRSASTPAHRAVLAVLVAASALAGCAASVPVVVRQPLERPVKARLVAVYPYAFRWEEPAHRSLLLAMEVVRMLVEKDRVAVIGPDEFSVYRGSVDDPRYGTDLTTFLADRNLPPTGFVALRPWAERRVQRTTGVIEGKGAVAHYESVEYVAHLDLLDGAGAGVLLELEAKAMKDPATPADPFDPTPELTRLHRGLMEAAWEALEPRLTADRLQPLPLQVTWLPANAMGWAPLGQRPLSEQLATMDPVQADLQRLAVYRFADPAADDATVAQRMRLPGGLLVEQAGGPFSVLRPGDVIVAAGRDPARGPQVLQRSLLQSRVGAIELTVWRKGARVPLTVVAR
jgi:hypothetical protein